MNRELAAFVDEGAVAGVAYTDGHRHALRISTTAEDRTAVMAIADRHGIRLQARNRYNAVITDGSGYPGCDPDSVLLRVNCQDRPRGHVALAAAQAMLAWDAEHASHQALMGQSGPTAPGTTGGEEPGLHAWLQSRAPNEQFTIRQKLVWAIEERLDDGEYGTDPQPADQTEHTLGVLIGDHLTLDSYMSGGTDLEVAAGTALELTHLVRGARMLAAAEPAAGRVTLRGPAPHPGVGSVTERGFLQA